MSIINNVSLAPHANPQRRRGDIPHLRTASSPSVLVGFEKLYEEREYRPFTTMQIN